MLHQQHGRCVFGEQPFQLHAGQDVDVIQRLIPNIQMGGDAQASRQQQLFLLSLGHALQWALEQIPGEIHVAQDGLEECFINAGTAASITEALGWALAEDFARETMAA